MTRRPRVASVDILRGAAMVLMAIDHVRVFAAVPAGGRAPSIFFTRWITHFCAPAFVFLAGTAIFLHARTLGQPAALSGFLYFPCRWYGALKARRGDAWLRLL